MNEAVAACLAGAISPPVALARMLLGGMRSDAIAVAVAAARPEPPGPAWLALAGLLEGRAAGLDGLAAQIARTGSDHTAMGGLPAIAAFFDGVVAHSPEAGVALYSLGDPAILAAATAEIVDWLVAERLVHPDAAVLDLGCGFGRVAAALAPSCADVLGVDVSDGMVAEARRRYGTLPGLRFAATDGSGLPPGTFDLVLLVDSMPYVHQAGLADGMVAGVAAALRPGGSLVVLNLSYGRDAAADAADAARWAVSHDWALTMGRPFLLWDGAAFVFRSPAASPRATHGRSPPDGAGDAV